MKNKITVSELIQGMKNLTRMREMIDELMDGIGGRLIKLADEHQFIGQNFIFEDERVSWQIRVGRMANNRKMFVVHCRRKEQGRDSGLALSYQTNSQTVLSMENVELVYDSLQVLLDGLLVRFPLLVEEAEVVAGLASKKL